MWPTHSSTDHSPGSDRPGADPGIGDQRPDDGRGLGLDNGRVVVAELGKQRRPVGVRGPDRVDGLAHGSSMSGISGSSPEDARPLRHGEAFESGAELVGEIIVVGLAVRVRLGDATRPAVGSGPDRDLEGDLRLRGPDVVETRETRDGPNSSVPPAASTASSSQSA